MHEWVSVLKKAEPGGADVLAARFEGASMLARCLTPFMPHLAEECWNMIGGEGLCSAAIWPEVDQSLLVEDCVALPIQVNGKRLDIPSYTAKKGDVVSLSPKAAKMIVVQHNIDTLDRSLVGWLEQGDGGKEVTVRSLPERDHIDIPVRESLIVELYSK